MSKPYDPRSAIRGATRAMRSYVRQYDKSLPDLTLETANGAIPCCVLLRSLTDRGPVPDDFSGLLNSRAIREHVRPDGAVYIGAYELQGHPESVVLVYGPEKMSSARAEQIASTERRALILRHNQWKLGPFANRPPVDTMVGNPRPSLLP